MNADNNKISINSETLQDIMMRTTNNPIAEDEIPKLLADIITSGGTIVVQGEAGQRQRIALEDGHFILKAL